MSELIFGKLSVIIVSNISSVSVSFYSSSVLVMQMLCLLQLSNVLGYSVGFFFFFNSLFCLFFIFGSFSLDIVKFSNSFLTCVQSNKPK